MIDIGQKQKLRVLEKSDIGVYLSEVDDRTDKVLLPRKQVPEGIEVGDMVDVFVYKDSEDRPVATREVPKLTMGELGILEVIEVTDIGAFLDWGLPKDLFLPFKEQTEPVEAGKSYLFGVYLDKSERLCATMKVSSFLTVDSPYKENDKVKGMVYSIDEEIGAFVAIDNKYEALIPQKEMDNEIQIGLTVEARVTAVKDDGKLDLSVKKKAYKQMKDDTKILLDILTENGGEMSLNDKSSPEDIKRQTNMSKNAFKRAIGGLFKARKIEFTEKGIRKI